MNNLFVETFCSCEADVQNVMTDVKNADGANADEVSCRSLNETSSYIPPHIIDSSSKVQLMIDRPLTHTDDSYTVVLSCEANETVDSVVLLDDANSTITDKQMCGDATPPSGTEAAQQQSYKFEESSSMTTEGLCNEDTIGKLLMR